MKGHVHELALSVHLKASQDGGVNRVLDDELLALVLRVLLKGQLDLFPLRNGQILCRDDGYLLFLIEGLVQLLVVACDLVNELESAVLNQHLNYLVSDILECSHLLHRGDQGLALLGSNGLVSCEHREHFRVLVELFDESHVFIDLVQSVVLRSSFE